MDVFISLQEIKSRVAASAGAFKSLSPNSLMRSLNLCADGDYCSSMDIRDKLGDVRRGITQLVTLSVTKQTEKVKLQMLSKVGDTTVPAVGPRLVSTSFDGNCSFTFLVCLVTDCVTHCVMPPALSPSLSRTEGSHNMRKNVCCEKLVIVCSRRNKWENRCGQSCSLPFCRRDDFIVSPPRARHSGERDTREKFSINLQSMQC
jgi:hypothetical protein